jgi:Tfp pilus assembly protein PilN
MIKINLSTAKKQMDISNVAGLDLTKIKIVPLLVALVLVYAPDYFLVPMFEEELNIINQNLTTKRQELGKLKSKIAQTAALEKQITELKAQEENLGQKLIAVKQAISEKRNPSGVLLYIAKNIPEELWIKELALENNEMLIKGEALDYTSIGSFINNLKASVFIKEANIISTNSMVRESDKRRIESFEVKFIIGKFE